jgi:hypothetical protein
MRPHACFVNDVQRDFGTYNPLGWDKNGRCAGKCRSRKLVEYLETTLWKREVDQTKSNVKYKETSVELSAWRLLRFCISPNAYKQMTRSKRLFKVTPVAIVDEA